MAPLTVSILYHTLLGIGLAASIWLVGLGYLLAARRDLERVRARDALDAYALGLVAVVVAALPFLLRPWLGPFGAAVAVAGVVLLVRERRRLDIDVRAVARPVAWSASGVVALPIVLGFALHGPTEKLDSRASGEMAFWVAKLVSAADSLVPFRDLLVEGQSFIYVEGAPPFLGALLYHLPAADAFLLHATTLPACFSVSLCLGLALLGRRVDDGEVATGATALWLPAVALLSLSLLAYPTWMTETPPVTLAAPLAFCVYRLWADPLPPSWFAALAAFTAVGFVMTKVVALLVVGILVAAVAVRRFGLPTTLDRRAMLAAGGLTLGALAVVGILFAAASWYADLYKPKFLPADAVRALRGQLSERNTQEGALALLLPGEILLVAVLVRLRNAAFAAALGVSVGLSWFVGGYGFDIAVAITIFVAALSFWERVELFARERRLVFAAALLLALSAWFRDIAGTQTGLIAILALGATLFPGLALSGRARGAGTRETAYVLTAAAVGVLLGLAGQPLIGGLAVASLLALPFVLGRMHVAERQFALTLTLGVAVATSGVVAAVIAGRGNLTVSNEPFRLTSDHYDVWSRVSALVPPGGLVFTTLTGRAITLDQGWNNYPAVSGRQLYLSGWYDGRLVSHPDELERRLELNRRVLSGSTSPERIGLERRFDSYFAVLRLREAAPPRFRLLYANARFAVYRIPA